MRRAYLHLPRFPLQRRVLEVPSLSGTPCVLVEEVRGQRRVAFASQAAQGEGVRAGMTLTAASALVAELTHAPHLAQETWTALRGLGESLLELGPAFQVDAPEGLWLDASAAHLWGGEADWGEGVLEALREQGLRGRVVIAGQSFTARALARHGELRCRVVALGGEAQALAPLPLAALEEAGGEVVAALRGLGLSSVGEVAALPPGSMMARGGAQALGVHRCARGGDESPFLPTPLPEVLEETLALDWPAEALEPVLFGLKTLVDRLCARLSGRKRAAVRLRLTLGLDPSGSEEVSLALARPTAQARLLLDLARHRLEGVTLHAPITSLRLRVEEDCEDPGQQLQLGEGPEGDAALEVVLSRLATTLGEEALSAVELQSMHRPEAASRPRPFRPPARQTGLAAGLLARAGRVPEAPRVEEVAPASAERPARLVTPPLRLEVSWRGEVLQGARLSGRWRRVVGLSGPERLVGEWWQPGAYARDYYRVHLEGVGWTWLYRDGGDGAIYLHGLFD